MDTREVYRGAKSDYYTHCHDLPPQIGGCRVESKGVPFKDEIDGKDGEMGGGSSVAKAWRQIPGFGLIRRLRPLFRNNLISPSPLLLNSLRIAHNISPSSLTHTHTHTND